MIRFLSIFAALVLPLAAGAQTPAMSSSPVKNFRMPGFNKEGVRTSLLRGSEARYVSQTQVDVTDMHFTSFAEDGSGKVETVLLAPVANVQFPNNQITVSGDQSVHIIRDDLNASGEQWTFENTPKDSNIQRRILLQKNVRVVFHSGFGDILK